MGRLGLILSVSASPLVFFPPADVRASSSARRGSDKALLADVKKPTFRRGRMTEGRRSGRVPQMRCVGGDACKHELEFVQCFNQGFDGRDFQWRCVADTGDAVRLGETTVTCEGYDFPNDDYVLVGSCGVEYQLFYTPKGKRLSSSLGELTRDDFFLVDDRLPFVGRPSLTAQIVIAIWCLGILYALYKIVRACMDPAYSEARQRERLRWDAGGDGGTFPPGGDDFGDGGGRGGISRTCRSSSAWRSAESPIPGTGFWTGVGLGGLAAHMAMRPLSTPTRRQPDFSAPSNRGVGPSSTRQSTGFGGTRRR
ncbi:MAG: hypothetical protein BJ554DRAFT_1490 [Olpidium bornovanus]|uniref:Store-operated calcium entry-associated regulatory factor n=1 Tax=Olpidium bornovanus TaxID=278681 RepID=A0A8H8DLU5_9FUNG|nr:MAG: hypothetical protein BJ554DRAFT_1490 [Olpidium bornovanus]